MIYEAESKSCPPHLPPRDAWKVNPESVKKFYAPIDDRGFVLPDATVEVVRDLFEDEYEWPIDFSLQSTRPDIHHFHWYERLYSPKAFGGRKIPSRFRELASVKGVLPRQFHNVVHEVTLPPAMPRYRDMKRHVDAYESASYLLQSAERTVEAQSLFALRRHDASIDDDVALGILISAFERQFKGYQMNMEQLIGAAGLSSLRVNDPKFERRKPHEVARILGRVVRNREINYMPLFRTVSEVEKAA